MIPLFSTIRIRNKQGRAFQLWVPLFLLWLLLLPCVVLLSPLIFLVCLAGQVNLLRAVSVVWQILAGLTNTHIEVDDPNNSVMIRVF
jgi:uncharacterized membrane protein